jgi:hypothetical protein
MVSDMRQSGDESSQPAGNASGQRREMLQAAGAAAVSLPPRLARFGQRVARLRPGKYVLTLTVKEDDAFWTIQEMGRVER